ncbi:MAG: YbjN domain-containing protein [Promethearchaeota archaeon]
MSLEKLKQILDNSGILYRSLDNFFITNWNINNEVHSIVIFMENEDWIICALQIDKFIKSERKNELYRILLKLNNKIIGVKFCLDINDKINVIAEININQLDAEYLKKIIIQLVKSVDKLYKDSKTFFTIKNIS